VGDRHNLTGPSCAREVAIHSLRQVHADGVRSPASNLSLPRVLVVQLATGPVLDISEYLQPTGSNAHGTSTEGAAVKRCA
jgi:hypothetical protein